MEFQDLGLHCSESLCRQRDFLPFQCDLCQKTYCLDHRATSSHNCQHANKNNKKAIVCPVCKKTLVYYQGQNHTEDQLWDIHRATECNPDDYKKYEEKIETKRCQFNENKKCKNKITETNTFVCKTCNRLLCLKHRFQSEHDCKPISKKQQQLNQQYAQPVEQKLKQRQEHEEQKEGNLFKHLWNREKPKNIATQNFKELDRPVCYVCGKSFDDYMQLVSHAEFAHQDQNNQQQSQQNYQNNNIQQNNQQNSNSNNTQSANQEKCQICGEMLPDLDALIIHAEQKHQN